MTDLETDLMIARAEIEQLQAQLAKYDEIAAEYGIDGKTMLTLAKSQIKTAQDNIKLQAQLSKEEARRRVQSERIEEERGRRYECIEAIGNLRTQLIASQRRERAAVEDIETLLKQDLDADKCWACTPDFDCGKEHRCQPTWRGPLEAGEGEAL